MSGQGECAGRRDSLAIYRLIDQLSDELGDAVSASKFARAGSARRIATLNVELVQDFMLRLARANYESLTPADRQRHDDAIEAYSGGAFSDYIVGPEAEDPTAEDRGAGSDAANADEHDLGDRDPVSHAFLTQCVAAGYLGCKKEPSGVLRYSLASRGAALRARLSASH
jgi:hypothetical protein